MRELEVVDCEEEEEEDWLPPPPKVMVQKQLVEDSAIKELRYIWMSGFVFAIHLT